MHEDVGLIRRSCSIAVVVTASGAGTADMTCLRIHGDSQAIHAEPMYGPLFVLARLRHDPGPELLVTGLLAGAIEEGQ
jgi:hypothetical protein